MGAYLTPFQALGQQFMSSALDAWLLLRFSVGSIAALARFFNRNGFRASARVTLQQVYYTGVEALPFLSLLSLLLGSTVLVQSLPQLQGVGAGNLIGKILVISVVRELGPTQDTAPTTDDASSDEASSEERQKILDRLQKGDITPDEAIKQLEGAE